LADAEVLFMLGADDDMDSVENVDVEVIHADGSRWSATLISLAEIGRIMERWKASGEGLGGRYFQCDDLVVTRDGGLANMIEVLGALVRSGEFRCVLARIDIED
jgi:hypothetical protein